MIHFGSDEQKKNWLPRLAAGDAIGTIALGEVDGVWQPEQWMAKIDGKLTGRKLYVPYANLADVIVEGARRRSPIERACSRIRPG